MGKLHDQMKMDLELKGYSEKTRQCYLERVAQFARHYQRSPVAADPRTRSFLGN